MRTVTYRALPGVGAGIGASRTVPLSEFVRRGVPYLLSGGAAPRPWFVPPLAVLNGVFRSGKDDAGMSGGALWTPFEVEQGEYEEVVAALAEHGYEPLPVDAPGWVKTREEWLVWNHELHTGLPSDEHRRLLAREMRCGHAWRESLKEAVERGDFTLAARRSEEWQRAAIELRNFLAGGDPEAARELYEPALRVEAARRRGNAHVALMRVRQIGDPGLIALWEREYEEASREHEARRRVQLDD